MTTAATMTSELVMLLPALAEALQKDNTSDGRGGVTPGVPVNGDVLSAIAMLHRQIPATTMAAAELVGEPWRGHGRKLTTCLLAISRYADRLLATGHAADAMALEETVRVWTRVTKLALRLREPDRVLPRHKCCPRCEATAPALYVAGVERFVHQRGSGFTMAEEHAGRIYCRHCAAVWGVAEWPWLGRQLAAVS